MSSGTIDIMDLMVALNDGIFYLHVIKFILHHFHCHMQVKDCFT